MPIDGVCSMVNDGTYLNFILFWNNKFMVLTLELELELAISMSPLEIREDVNLWISMLYVLRQS